MVMTQPAAAPGFPPPRGGTAPPSFHIPPSPVNDDRGDHPGRGKPRGTLLGLRAGQIVIAQIALVLAATTASVDPLWLVASGPISLVLLVVAFGRARRRWLYQWIGQGARYFGRRRTLPSGSPPAAVLGLLRPGAIITSIEIGGVPVGIVEDAYGLTAVLEAGDTTGVLAEKGVALPGLAAFLPAAASDQPTVRLQLLLTGVAAPSTHLLGTTAAATSYRQLTEGRILAQQRALLAVHVRRVGRFPEADLQRALASAVRRVRRRLDRTRVPCRMLAGDSVLQAIADLAHHEVGRPFKENWSTVELGHMQQTCLQLIRWPDVRGELASTFLPRLLTMQGGSTTVALTVERDAEEAAEFRAECVVRLAAPSPSALAGLVRSLRALLAAASARARPLDGTQLEALAATLPLGGASSGSSAMLAGVVAGGTGLGVSGTGLPVTAPMLAALHLPLGNAGMMLGVNRHGDPVVVRMFRGEPTRAAIIGGIRCAQVVLLRALAVGAHAVVLSGRPYAWDPFLRAIGAHASGSVMMAQPGQVLEPPPASAVRPQLLVVDVGPVGTTGVPVVEGAWRTTLLVRDDLGQADLDVLSRVDLALLQPLATDEAHIAAAALGLGDAGGWLTRIRADMIGVVIGRRTLRWALVSGTPIEHQTIGPLVR
ncbi:MAG: type VII secretion protein EccE [Dactylosporangium sp.]|nr:type VII secretion protein EccE [Dactylosporangium sp.]NNJ60088.1 type VII secretion protein EccE [Dactylosporangium sp.]